METRRLGCPICGAAPDISIGVVEALCEYCGSKLRFISKDHVTAIGDVLRVLRSARCRRLQKAA